jgi:hypothetical protein
VIDEWHLLAYHEIEEMTKRNVPGVWTHGFYDGWAPNYMFYVANGHNSIGRFYETYGGQGADTSERTVGPQATRDWYRPNPPLPRVKWSIRNNINLQESAILFAMNFVSNSKERFLNNFYLKSKRSVAKATNEGPAAWVIPVTAHDRRRPPTWSIFSSCRDVKSIGPTRRLRQGRQVPAGSYVFGWISPTRAWRICFSIRSTTTSTTRALRRYRMDAGPLRDIKTVRVKDEAVLKVPMTLINGPAVVSGR